MLMDKAYATAIIASLDSGLDFDRVFANLKKLLSQKGHERLYGAILRTTTKLLEQRDKSKAPHVTVAKASVAKGSRVAEILKNLQAENLTPKVVVDETLIGGQVVRFAGVEVDESYKSALLKLYRNITK